MGIKKQVVGAIDWKAWAIQWAQAARLPESLGAALGDRINKLAPSKPKHPEAPREVNRLLSGSLDSDWALGMLDASLHAGFFKTKVQAAGNREKTMLESELSNNWAHSARQRPQMAKAALCAIFMARLGQFSEAERFACQYESWKNPFKGSAFLLNAALNLGSPIARKAFLTRGDLLWRDLVEEELVDDSKIMIFADALKKEDALGAKTKTGKVFWHGALAAALAKTCMLHDGQKIKGPNCAWVLAQIGEGEHPDVNNKHPEFFALEQLFMDSVNRLPAQGRMPIADMFKALPKKAWARADDKGRTLLWMINAAAKSAGAGSLARGHMCRLAQEALSLGARPNQVLPQLNPEDACIPELAPLIKSAREEELLRLEVGTKALAGENQRARL